MNLLSAYQEEMKHHSPCPPSICGFGARALPGCWNFWLFLLPFP